jgi:hypothetical protein
LEFSYSQDANHFLLSITPYPYWISSHSLAQRVIAHCGSFIAASANDAYPRGISLHILNPFLYQRNSLDTLFYHVSQNHNIFSDITLGIKAKLVFSISGAIGDNNIRGTELGNILVAPNNNIILTFCTGDKPRSDDELQDVGMLTLSRTGEQKNLTWFSQTPNVAEMNVRTLWIGKGSILVIWDAFSEPINPERYLSSPIPPTTGNKTKQDWKFLHSSYMIIDSYGKIIQPPKQFDTAYKSMDIATTYRRTRSYNAITMPNGEAFIVRMTHDSSKVDISKFSIVYKKKR